MDMVRSSSIRLSVTLSLVGLATALLFVGARAGTATLAGQAQAPEAIRLVPPDLQDTTWLLKLRDEQVKSAGTVAAFHDFQFTDRIAESGIAFRHRVVDDAGKTYKAAHYDHGNGLAIADVDGDGREDIYFVNQVGPNGLWKNAGGGKFQDITAAAGVAVPGKVGVSASFADIDNDGDADLYVTTVRGGNVLFQNDGKGRFSDISAASGLGYVGHSSGAVFFDYNRDGRLDLFLVNVGKYTTDTIAGAGYQYLRGVRGCFSRPPQTGAGRTEHPLSKRGRKPLRRRLEGDGPGRHVLVGRRQRG